MGLELVKAYLTDGWKVIAAVRDPSTMPNLDAPEGDLIIVRLDAGEKEDARMVSLIPRPDCQVACGDSPSQVE